MHMLLLLLHAMLQVRAEITGASFDCTAWRVDAAAQLNLPPTGVSCDVSTANGGAFDIRVPPPADPSGGGDGSPGSDGKGKSGITDNIPLLVGIIVAATGLALCALLVLGAVWYNRRKRKGGSGQVRPGVPFAFLHGRLHVRISG